MKNLPYRCLFMLLFLTSCGGGGKGASQTQITTSLQADEPQIDFIFGRLHNFEGALTSAYAIDVNSGALRFIDPNDDLYSFLSKQPDIKDTQIILPNGDESHSALAHLYHDIGQASQNGHKVDSFNQIDPGHFFLWGYQTNAPPTSLDYELETLWFCGDCDVSFGQDSARLSVTGDEASLSMTTDERHLILPLSLSSGGLIHNDISPVLRAVGSSQDLSISQWQASGGFFGPEAEEAGVIFSLFYDQSVFSAAGSGTKTE